MKFNSRGGVSIVELFIYFPSIVIAFIICRRHGFNRSSGWIFTLILCLIRIIGACCQLATYASQSSGLEEATFILDSVGVSPLLLATLGLLSRCVDTTNLNSSNLFHTIQFRATQLTITLGLILSIVGGTSSVSADGTFHPQTTSKAGVLLYVLAFASLAVTTILTIPKFSKSAKSYNGNDKRIALAVVIALPFLAVRITYSILAVFLHNHDFNVIDGSVTILVVMAVLEEFLVVIIYLVVGWMAETLAVTSRGPLTSRPWKGGGLNHVLVQTNGGGGMGRQSGGIGGGGGGGRGRSGFAGGMRQGPIHSLVGMAVNAASERSRGHDVERGAGI